MHPTFYEPPPTRPTLFPDSTLYTKRFRGKRRGYTLTWGRVGGNVVFVGERRKRSRREINIFIRECWDAVENRVGVVLTYWRLCYNCVVLGNQTSVGSSCRQNRASRQPPCVLSYLCVFKIPTLNFLTQTTNISLLSYFRNSSNTFKRYLNKASISTPAHSPVYASLHRAGREPFLP